MFKPASRPALPADAIGFISRRDDRPERLALFDAKGKLSNTFAFDQDMADVAEILLKAGLIMDDAGIVRYNGGVGRVA
jgi:hypothetical protein